MQKKRLPRLSVRAWNHLKFLLLMKLTFAIVLISCLQVSAKGYGQEKKLTLNFTNAPIEKVFRTIEQNTDLKFVYADNFFSSNIKVSLNVKQTPLTQILEMVLANTGFSYQKMEDLIIITSIKNSTQSFPVKGIVRNSNDEPLEGVTVSIENSEVKTITDSYGAFTIESPEANPVLIFSNVGFLNSRVLVRNGNAGTIILEKAVKDLNEVVVVGYGTQRKREVTSAITHVSAEDFNKGNVSNVAGLLQGKVAGLSISKPGNDPNTDYVIRIRGLSTLGSNAQPLIVIDGQIGADLNTVDPNDIKSFDILKDGSAAAIYGTRGSAGVIIITTKSGSLGNLQVNYNGSVTSENPYKFTSHMSAAQYRAANVGKDYGSSTDWDKEITRTAYSTAQNLNINGGVKGTTYSASVNYRNNQGVAINTGNQSLNTYFNISQKALGDRLVLKLNVNTTTKNADYGNASAFKWATIFNPTAPVHSTDPLYNTAGGGYFETPGILDYYNPVAVLEQISNEGTTKRFNMNGSGEYEIIPGLKFLLRYAEQSSSFYSHSYNPINAQLTGFQRHGLATKGDDESFNQLFESIISYSHTFNKIHFNAIAGYSYQDFLNQGFAVSAGNFLTDASSENFLSALDFKNGLATGTSYKNASKLIAFFGRVEFNYDNLAFLTASLRKEGSSEFGANNQWGYFPAVGAGFDFSRYMKTTEVNNLKLRASYGVTGALPPGPYLSLERITNQGGTYYAGDGNYLQTYSTFVNPNPDLQWEKKGEFDAGLDFVLFNSRLSGTFDYFNRDTKNLIFDLTVPSPPNLNPTTWKNIGEIKNYGFEVSLNFDVIKKQNFTWTTGGNYSSYHLVLAKLDESLDNSYVGAAILGSPGYSGVELTRAVAGQPLGILWGLKYRGLDKNGKYLFDDGHGNAVGQDSAKSMVIGNGLPKFEFGWNNTFRYKNFDLNFFFRGSIGHDLVNTYRAFYETPTLAGYNIVNTKYYNPALKDAQVYSSLYVENASFVKLDNATIAYNIPLHPPAGKAPVVRSLRIYLTGQNLFTITKYTGVDPEARYTDTNPDGTINQLASGIDRRETWVYTRAFTFGVNLGF